MSPRFGFSLALDLGVGAYSEIVSRGELMCATPHHTVGTLEGAQSLREHSGEHNSRLTALEVLMQNILHFISLLSGAAGEFQSMVRGR